jgi:carbon starvation protein
VFIVGLVVAFKAIRGSGRPLTEDEPVLSKLFAPSGLIPTATERKVQRQWDALPAPAPGVVDAQELSIAPPHA